MEITIAEKYEQKALGILQNRSLSVYPTTGCYFRAIDRLFENMKKDCMNGLMSDEEFEEISTMALNLFGMQN